MSTPPSAPSTAVTHVRADLVLGSGLGLHGVFGFFFEIRVGRSSGSGSGWGLKFELRLGLRLGVRGQVRVDHPCRMLTPVAATAEGK